MSNKVSRFAALMGGLMASASPAAIAASPAAAAAAEKPTQRDDESDEDFKDRLKKWEDEQDDDTSAESPKDTSDDDQDKEKDLKKKAQATLDQVRAEGHAAGIAAERARWDGVLASPAAAGRVITACSLLADTDMNAASIQKTLAALPAETGRTTLATRTGGNPTPAPAADGGEDKTKATGPAGFAARVAAAVAKTGKGPKPADKAA